MKTSEYRKIYAEHHLISTKRKVNKKDEYRHKLMVSYIKEGNTLDIGFGHVPNKFLNNPIGLDIAKVPKPENYSNILIGNACNLPFKNETFDNILAGELVEHLENPCQFYRECHRVLKQKGRLIISTPNPCNPIAIIKNELLGRYPHLTDHISEAPPT